MDIDIKSFLQETKFCDFSNPKIQELAKEIAKNCRNDREIAIAAFYWVRDNILYRVGLWRKKASETLKEKKGTCTNKANLLVAILRALNIPASYGVMKVDGQRYMGPVEIPMLAKFVSKVSVHGYALVYLDGKWVKCDPSVDLKLGESIHLFNKKTKLIEWDGQKDAILDFEEEDVLSDNFPIANIDYFLNKKPRNAKGILLKIANIYTEFVRKNKLLVSNTDELEDVFKKWLKKTHPVYCLIFSINYWLKNNYKQ